MANERRLDEVPVVLFTIAGGIDGTVTIPSTSGFKVKSSVVISATSLPNLTLEVKAVLSETILIVGLSGNINNRYDLSSYTTFLNSSIYQPSQDRPKVPKDDQDRATYESEPTLARRTILVDELGNLHTDANPLPVSIASVELPLRFDESSSNIMYLAEGVFGALDNEPKWKIKKIEINGTLFTIKLASNKFNQIWDDRTSLTYV